MLKNTRLRKLIGKACKAGQSNSATVENKLDADVPEYMKLRFLLLRKCLCYIITKADDTGL